MPRASTFQFQIGAIRRYRYRYDENRLQKSFNSKLVRLEVHNFPELRQYMHRFNSKLVRLEGKELKHVHSHL